MWENGPRCPADDKGRDKERDQRVLGDDFFRPPNHALLFFCLTYLFSGQFHVLAHDHESGPSLVKN